MSRILAAGAAALLLGGAATAAPEPLPPVLDNLTAQGLAVVKRFEAPGGLTGYVVDAGGQHRIIYVTADGKHALLGALLDDQGRNLTLAHQRDHVPAPDYAAAWQALEDARWVAVGAEEPETVVYVLADPHCPYCHAFWEASRAYWDAGLQARWIMVSYLRADGPAKAAAILEADDPAAALMRHQERFRQGGIEPAAKPEAATLKAIETNTGLMREFGITGTPAILFKGEDGEVQLVQGMPKLDALPEIFQLPRQEVDAPGLERFR